MYLEIFCLIAHVAMVVQIITILFSYGFTILTMLLETYYMYMYIVSWGLTISEHTIMFYPNPTFFRNV